MASANRVGLVVHYGLDNYGNHLTNYAARRVLERCGSDVDLIVFTGGRLGRLVFAVRRLPRRTIRLLREGKINRRVLARVTSLLRRAPELKATGHSYMELRRTRFREFSQERLRPVFVPVRARRKLDLKYDLFVVGSDQIWNYDHQIGPWFFLDFTNASKKACLAPSVGHRELPSEWESSYRRWLSDFDEISVRESIWVDGLEQLIGSTRVTLLPDPTLMLTAEEWAEIAHPASVGVGYILVYLLGGKSEQVDTFMCDLSKSLGLVTVLLSPATPGDAWASNAAEFVDMVQNATLVITDSYHGSIFAFLFDRPLVVVPRSGAASGMNTRIESLLTQLSIHDRLIDVITVKSAMEHDYSDGQASVRELRRFTWQYLARRGLAVPSSLNQ